MEKFTDVFAEITRPLAKIACAMFIAFLIGGISCCFASEPTALEREKASAMDCREWAISAKPYRAS